MGGGEQSPFVLFHLLTIGAGLHLGPAHTRPSNRVLSPELAHVGRGIGRALLAHALDDLRRHGYQAAMLRVLATNARARRFYEAAGWAPAAVTRTEQHPAGVVLNERRYVIDLAATGG